MRPPPYCPVTPACAGLSAHGTVSYELIPISPSKKENFAFRVEGEQAIKQMEGGS